MTTYNAAVRNLSCMAGSFRRRPQSSAAPGSGRQDTEQRLPATGQPAQYFFETGA